MGIAINFGYRIPYKDHAIIMLDATAHSEGGGPWPADLRDRFLNPIGRGVADPAASYTSHDQ